MLSSVLNAQEMGNNSLGGLFGTLSKQAHLQQQSLYCTCDRLSDYPWVGLSVATVSVCLVLSFSLIVVWWGYLELEGRVGMGTVSASIASVKIASLPGDDASLVREQ